MNKFDDIPFHDLLFQFLKFESYVQVFNNTKVF